MPEFCSNHSRCPTKSLYPTHYHPSLLKHKASLIKGNPCHLFCWHLHIISPLRQDRKCFSWQLQQGWCFKALKPKVNNFSHWSAKIPPIQSLCPSIITNSNADNNINKHCEGTFIKHCEWQSMGAVRFKDALHLSVIAERHCNSHTQSQTCTWHCSSCCPAKIPPISRQLIKLILPANTFFNAKYTAYPYPLLSQPAPPSSLTAECQLWAWHDV